LCAQAQKERYAGEVLEPSVLGSLDTALLCTLLHSRSTLRGSCEGEKGPRLYHYSASRSSCVKGRNRTRPLPQFVRARKRDNPLFSIHSLSRSLAAMQRLSLCSQPEIVRNNSKNTTTASRSHEGRRCENGLGPQGKSACPDASALRALDKRRLRAAGPSGTRCRPLSRRDAGKGARCGEQ